MFFQEKNFVRNLEFWFGFGYLNRENTSTCFIRPSNDVMEKYIIAFFLKIAHLYFLAENSKRVTPRVYRRDGVMAQKVIEGDNDTCQHMHLILRWLKIRTIYFDFIYSAKY